MFQAPTKCLVESNHSLAHLYHANSKASPYFTNIGSTSQKQYNTINESKDYPSLPRTILEDPCGSPTPFQKILTKRRSVREFSNEVVSLQILSKLIYSAFGISATSVSGNKSLNLRVVPSAGALYPIELYLASFRVDEIRPGLYHYNCRHRALEFLGDEKLSLLNKVWLSPEYPKNASLVFIISAIFQRSMIKYGTRGYRFALMEAGLSAEHIALQATELELKSAIICGFYDDLVNALFGLDGVDESTLCTVACGF